MIKYMKYEIQGTYKFILGLILTVLVASTGLQLYGLNSLNNFNNSNTHDFPVEAFLVTLLVLVIFGAFITSLFYIIGSFRKELYEDRGYLTFTLPLTGKQILGSKLVIALMWIVILTLATILYNLLLGSLLFGATLIEQLMYLASMAIENLGIVTVFTLSNIIGGVITLLLIYFSITLSKVSIRNKKLGGLWFIFFLILNSIISYVTFLVSYLVPYGIDLNSFSIISSNNAFNMGMTGSLFFTVMGVNSNQGIFLNIGSIIFSLLVVVGLFIGTSYLIENKIDI